MDAKDRELVEVEIGGKKQCVYKGEIPMLQRLGLLKEHKAKGQTKELKEKQETLCT